MSANEQPNDFEAVKNRLAEIADAVDDESISLDDALDLYEEAVALGLKASDLLETGVVVPEEGVGETADEGKGENAASDGLGSRADGSVEPQGREDSTRNVEQA